MRKRLANLNTPALAALFFLVWPIPVLPIALIALLVF